MSPTSERLRAAAVPTAVLALLALLLAGAWLVVGAERGRTESVLAIGELRAATSAYVEHVLLESAGLPASPDAVAGEMHDVIDAFLVGGRVPGASGGTVAPRLVEPVTSKAVVAQLVGQRDLVAALVATGDEIRGTEPDTPAWAEAVQGLRVRAAELRALITETADQMAAESRTAHRRQLASLALFGLLAVGGGTVSMLSARRGGRASESARYEALVHGSSDGVLVIDAADHVTYATGVGATMFDADPGTIGGRPLVDLVAATSVDALQQALTTVRSGAGPVDARVAIGGPDGMHWLALRLTDLAAVPGVGGVVINARDITDEVALTGELERMAYEDRLTGLANRAVLVDHLDRGMARAARRGQGPALLYLDLDNFKTVNDVHGHALGDELLREISRRILHAVRDEDVVARLGGDEFAVLVDPGGAHALTLDDTFALADRIVEAVRRPATLPGGIEVSVGASMGIRPWLTSDDDSNVMMRDADVAMYVAKADAKGGHRIFDATMHESVVTRHLLAQDLGIALAEGQLWLALQPQVRSSDGAVVGLEALARWDHPTRGSVSPGEFIPVAETTGLIIEIGRWVLREGAALVGRLDQHAGLEHVRVSINVSSRQLVTDQFVDDVAAVLVEQGINPERLMLEITETALASDPDRCTEQLSRLRLLGVAISIDDFGTGASSLSRLHRFPIDELKIDRAFVVDAVEPLSRGRTMLRTIAALGRELELSLVAEGVETEEQLEAARATGSDVIQGFLFGRPVPFDEFVTRWGTATVPAPAITTP